MVQFCNREENWEPSKSDVICSAHFQESDFQMPETGIVGGKVLSRTLLANGKFLLAYFPNNDTTNILCFCWLLAIPSIHSELSSQIENQEEDSSENFVSSTSETLLVSDVSKIPQNTSTALLKENIKLREANKRLKATLSHIASENYQLKKVQDLEKEFGSLKNNSIPPSDLIPKKKNILKSTPTSNQVDLIIGEKKRVR